MSKYFWGLFWIVAGIAIFIISSMSDTLNCSRDFGVCKFQSKIAILNIKINEENFDISEIKSIQCIKTSQPSKSGKKTYYTLKLFKTDDSAYNLGSYQKYAVCKEETQPIRNLLKGKTDTVTYNSGSGFSNFFGYIFGIIMLIIGLIVLTSKEEFVEEDNEN